MLAVAVAVVEALQTQQVHQAAQVAVALVAMRLVTEAA
jgi:hypothetical protein